MLLPRMLRGGMRATFFRPARLADEAMRCATSRGPVNSAAGLIGADFLLRRALGSPSVVCRMADKVCCTAICSRCLIRSATAVRPCVEANVPGAGERRMERLSAPDRTATSSSCPVRRRSKVLKSICGCGMIDNV